MKKTKIVVPALAVLLLSTAASVSGTVAWFSMNNSVNVTGMTVTTRVSSNLQISEVNTDSIYTSEDLQQSREGILEPASSYNGATFYYTTSAKGDGAASSSYTLYNENTTLNNPYANKTSYDRPFNNAYQFSDESNAPFVRPTDSGEDGICYGYIDYSFYLKGTASGAGQKLAMTSCQMKYDGAAVTDGYAWRVGLFAKELTGEGETADSAVISEGVITILDFGTNSKNQNEVTKAVVVQPGGSIEGLYTTQACDGAAGAANATNETGVAATYYRKGEDAPKAVSGTALSALTAVTNAGAEALINTSAANDLDFRYKVVVRLWLEGEDINCTSSTFAELTEDWTLDLSFNLGSGAGSAGAEAINA